MKIKNKYLLWAGLIITSMAVYACEAVENQLPESNPTPVSVIDTLLQATSTPLLSQISNLSPTPSTIPSTTEVSAEFVQDNCPVFGMPPAIPSPDGQWLASGCFDGENAHIRIARFDHTKAWDLNFEDITGVSPCLSYENSYGEPICFHGVLYIDHWFKTGRYVFVSADYLIDRGSTFSFGLYRIDTENGRVSAYLPMGDYTYNYAFSPNDDYYAYVTASDNYLLHIVSLESGENLIFTAPGRYSSLGELIWSPDNEKIVFLARGIGWEENPKVGFSLDIFNVETEKFLALVLNDARRLKPVKWLSDSSLLLSGKSEDGQSYLDYQLDISNNQMMVIPEVTPTP